MKQTDKKLSLAGLVVILFLNIVVQAQSAITLISAQRDVGVGLFSSPSGSPLPAQDASTASLNYWDQTVSMGPNEPGASFATDYGLATQTSDFGSVSGFSNSTLTSLGSRGELYCH